METILKNKISKAVVDMIMLLCLIGCIHSSFAFEKSMENIRNGASYESLFAWGTLHCATGLIFICFMGIHIVQRLNFYKALIRKKLYLKNKLITLVTTSFLLLIVSLLLFLTGFTDHTLHFHFVFAHLFALTIIVHSVTKLKQLLDLFLKSRNNKKRSKKVIA